MCPHHLQGSPNPPVCEHKLTGRISHQHPCPVPKASLSLLQASSGSQIHAIRPQSQTVPWLKLSRSDSLSAQHQEPTSTDALAVALNFLLAWWKAGCLPLNATYRERRTKKLQGEEETQGCQAEREQETDPGPVLLEVSISYPPTPTCLNLRALTQKHYHEKMMAGPK